ncbi:MAG: hypothetical protein H7Y13_10560, partial [Sphingobacteriaceae bacterium]|nr:hypothetical protein [Sphingobacteriaceae bacterium]
MQKLLLNLIFFMLPLNVIYAQSIDSSAVQKLEHYSKKAVQEKLFAHTDKSVYLAGELMWFKLYLMDGSSHSQSTLSSVS